MYLFDIRIIESKVYLDSANNQFGSDQVQPHDALFKVDLAMPVSIFPKDSLSAGNLPFIESPYFEALKKMKSNIDQK